MPEKNLKYTYHVSIELYVKLFTKIIRPAGPIKMSNVNPDIKLAPDNALVMRFCHLKSRINVKHNKQIKNFSIYLGDRDPVILSTS